MIDHIYFLTLNESLSRKDNVRKQIDFLNNHGYSNCEMFKNYRWPKAISNYLKNTVKPELGQGIYSCTTGHYAIMNDALQNNYEYILIIEDDVILTEDFVDFLRKLETKYQTLDFDCMKLYYRIEGLTEEEFDNLKYGWIDDELFKFSKLQDNQFLFSTLCFVVNQKFMKAYIEYFDNYIRVADRPMCDHDNFIDKYDINLYVHKNRRLTRHLGENTTLYY